MQEQRLEPLVPIGRDWVEEIYDAIGANELPDRFVDFFTLRVIVVVDTWRVAKIELKLHRTVHPGKRMKARSYRLRVLQLSAEGPAQVPGIDCAGWEVAFLPQGAEGLHHVAASVDIHRHRAQSSAIAPSAKGVHGDLQCPREEGFPAVYPSPEANAHGA